MSDIDSKVLSQTAKSIIDAARRAQSETDLQTDVEHALRNIFQRLGIEYEPHHNITVIRGRPDTLYGRAVIEYKIPGTLRSGVKRTAAIEEAQKNIQELSMKYHEEKSKYIGIILDGFQITFTKFRQDKWLVEPISEVNPETTRRMLEYLRGLARKPLHPDFMVRDFGPESELAKACVRLLYDELKESDNPRTKVLYEEWRKTFNQVCGYDFVSPKLDIRQLLEAYEIAGKKVNFIELLFVIHTYYALVIKLLAAEITVTYASPYMRSFLDELLSSSPDRVREKLRDLEEGGVFSEFGIRNFLEGDFFGWYIDLWNPNIAGVTSLIIQTLAAYEPATAALEPDAVRDLLKKLYQYLVPNKIRHDLGEFFTPDWLAELVLDEAQYCGEITKRILDPGCGSGTFLVLAIKRIKESSADAMLDKADVLASILKNVIGFDLNPLAIIASRTNYLIALGELVRHRQGDIYIPVYLCDSISTKGAQTLYGAVYEVSTSVGKFEVPAEVAKEKKIDQVFSIVDDCIKNQYKPSDFANRLKNEFSELSETGLGLLRRLYEELLSLEQKGVNRIWTRVIKNAFAPRFVGKFDYVVGNPPWVNWEHLPEDYRDSTRSLWVDYGLIAKEKLVGLGKAKKDVSMLFVCVSISRYLSETGRLAFLVPFTLFKMQAGAGFRQFLASRTDVRAIHDMVELRPFEGTINRTSLVVLEKGKTTSFPISSVMWTKKTGGEIDQFLDLEEVRKIVRHTKMVVAPVAKSVRSSWLMVRPKALSAVRKALGKSDYEAHAGIYTDMNGVYWVEVLEKQPKTLLVRNLADIGKRKVERTEASIENELVFPLLRGRDVDKWKYSASAHIILPINKEGKTLSLRELRSGFPKAFGYFNRFRGDLISRGGEPYKSMLADWRKPKVRNEDVLTPFYFLVNAEHSLSPFKVVWKYISGEIAGKGEFFVSTVSPLNDDVSGNIIAATDHRLMVVPCGNEREADYVAGVLNSSLARLIVKSYTIETAISTHVLNNVRVPRFDPRNELHVKIASLSAKARSLASQVDGSGLSKVEERLDDTVAKLFGLSEDELEEVKSSLAMMSGEF